MKLQIQLPFPVLFFIAFFSFHVLGFTQDIHFTLVRGAREEGSGSVAEMAQDSQGFLWLATESGLYKYDGHHYTAYHYEPSNPNSPAAVYIRRVIVDRTGYIWLAPHYKGLDRLDPATGLFTHFRHNKNNQGSLGNDTVWAILQDHEGAIWLGTSGGLDRFDSASNKFFHYRNIANDSSSLSCNVVRALYEDKQGTLWIGTGNPYLEDKSVYDSSGGLNKLNRKTGSFIRFMHDENSPNTLIDNRVFAMFEDSRGNFWVGTAGDGLHTMDRTKGTFDRHRYDSSHPNKLSRTAIKDLYPTIVTDHITFITEDNRGRIWIGTLENGINVYDPSTQKMSYYGYNNNSKQKLRDKGFWMAYKSRDNVIWVSEYEFGPNLNLYKINPFQNASHHINMGQWINAFSEDDAKTLWIASNKGLIHKDSIGKEERFLINEDSSSPLNGIGSIEKDKNKFWLSTIGGLYVFDPVAKTFSGFHHQEGNPNSIPSDTLTIKKGMGDVLWISGPDISKGISMMDTKSGTLTHFKNRLGSSNVTSSYQVSAISVYKQIVWLSTDNGLYKFNIQTGVFKKYLDQLALSNVVEDDTGELWAGTSAGLFRYDKEKDEFLSFTDVSGVLNATFAATGWMREDRRQNLWFPTVKGIIRLNKERNNVILYGKNSINNGAFTGSVYIRQNGNILFSDTLGYFEINPGSLQQSSSPPYVNISNFLLNNVSVKPSEKGILPKPLIKTHEISLAYNQNTFSFAFSNIDFVSEHEDTRLIYMLQNYDNIWHKAEDDNTAYYFNISPGKYIFKVKAINAFGIAAEKDIIVVVSPPWWKTWWAYTLYGLCFLFLLFYANHYIRNKIVEKERVKSREKELAQAKEIEKAYNELRGTQAQLIQSEKMASLGELTAGIAHEIQNPLNFVNNFSDVNTELIDELQNEIKTGNTEEAISLSNEIKENEQKINHHGKRADTIVKGMLLHSRSSTGKKEPTDINALADEYLRLAYHGLRAKDKNFNAEIKTDFDESIGKINLVPQDIGRVLLNLYNNAFYAVNEKKQQLAEAFEPIVAVTTKKNIDKVEISVKDNGNGIPQKAVDKIFQPFFTTKPTGQGTGLGLSISYDIIKAHSGDLKVTTREGKGSEFIIQLPISKF